MVVLGVKAAVGPRDPDGHGFSTVFRDDPKRVNVARGNTTEMRPVEYVPSIRS